MKPKQLLYRGRPIIVIDDGLKPWDFHDIADLARLDEAFNSMPAIKMTKMTKEAWLKYEGLTGPPKGKE